MDQDEFAIWLDELVGLFDRTDTLFAKTTRGMMPVGWVMSNIEERRVVPHVEWAAWVTPRNKVEAALVWLHQLRHERTREGLPLRAIIETRSKDRKFFEHMKRYGVLGGGFRIPDLNADRSDGWFFYLKGS